MNHPRRSRSLAVMLMNVHNNQAGRKVIYQVYQLLNEPACAQGRKSSGGQGDLQKNVEREDGNTSYPPQNIAQILL